MSQRGDGEPIRKVLVANRGEIAVRIMRTLRERDIRSVAVYSDVDRLSLHVLRADEAAYLGAAPANESYLDISKIIAACRAHNVDALHPGYGFHSENDAFAEALEEAGITLIGPPADAMRLMGSKTEARKAVERAGLPVVPGNNGPEGCGFPTLEGAMQAASEVGFPILIKAAAGGGGKGMRLVDEASAFKGAFEAAKREAMASFGDDTVYVEKAIVQPRHVEIQIFADNFGNVVHLGERDCSVQRRHQKVVEEAPSPAVDDALRQRMGASAVQAAQACNYRGAGTVEFLLADDGQYYFLEMNTRLQVEHPVTEMIYGLDLVAWQVDIAQGKPLPLTQDEIRQRRRGWSFECRIYAEDSLRFLPSPGKITRLDVPSGPFVRDDSGAYEGSEISVHYDPLISKLIVWGEDRPQALARMKRALTEYRVVGIESNLPFHHRLFRHPDFLSGHYDTGLIGRSPELTEADETTVAETKAVALAAALHGANSKPQPESSSKTGAAVKASNWRRQGQWSTF